MCGVGRGDGGGGATADAASVSLVHARVARLGDKKKEI